MRPENGDVALCKNCGKEISYDKPYRSWYHWDTELTAPDDLYCKGMDREDDEGEIAEPVES